MSTAAAAIRYLESRALSTEAILDRLSATSDAVTLLALYQKYFPKEFGKLSLKWSDTESLMKACCNFYHLVDQRLFPCHCPLDMADYEDVINLRDILVYAPWPAWYECFDLSRLQRVILAAVGEIFGDGDDNESYRINNQMQQDRRLNYEVLEELCRNKRAPLCHLPLAANFVLKGTGNTWCDVTDEEICSSCEWPEWNEENIDYLAALWEEAKGIFGKFRHLEDWVISKPLRAKTVEKLIEKAMKPVVRCRVGDPTPLCEQLAGLLDEEIDDDDFEE